MSSKNVVLNEKINLKAILATSPFKENLLNLKSLFGKKIIKCEKVEENISYAIFIYSSMNNIAPESLLNKGNAYFSVEENQYIYNVIVCEFIFVNSKYLLIMAPSNAIINDLFKTTSLKFNRIDLTKICSDQFMNSYKRDILIKRLSARMISPSSKNITSITAFGENILGKKEIFDFLGVDTTNFNPKFNPFDPETSKLMPQRRKIRPNSCRLKLVNPPYDKTSLNLDIFGNYSLFFNNYDSIEHLYKFFNYFNENKSIIGDIVFDQLKRSKRSLELIENGN